MSGESIGHEAKADVADGRKKSFAAIRTKNIQLMDNSTVHFGHGVEIITAHGRKFKKLPRYSVKKHLKLKVISFFLFIVLH